MGCKIYTLDCDAERAKLGDKVVDTKVRFDPDGEVYDTGDPQEIGTVLDYYDKNGDKMLYLKFDLPGNKIKKREVNISKDINSGLCRYRLVMSEK